MKTIGPFLGFLLATVAVNASLPVITTHPTNQTVAPSNNAVFVVESPNILGYQWRFNGVDIPWGTNSPLIITNAQTVNNGYYMAVAKNATGWTPSRMGYLSVVEIPGGATFRNYGSNTALYRYSSCGVSATPITNGTAQLFAGPALDYMLPMGSVSVTNGYFSSSPKAMSNVRNGQEMFYRIDISYVVPCLGLTNIQPSTTLKTRAGAYSPTFIPNPTPAIANLTFPLYPEWPDPVWFFDPDDQTKVVGETTSLRVYYYALFCPPDCDSRSIQWRKDGVVIPGWTNKVLALTNVSPNHAGVYDVIALTPNFYDQGVLSEKVLLSVQTSGGQGELINPRKIGNTFISDLKGAVNRRYQVLTSSNLVNWSNLLIVTNTTGTAMFTSPLGTTGAFYRAVLLP